MKTGEKEEEEKIYIYIYGDLDKTEGRVAIVACRFCARPGKVYPTFNVFNIGTSTVSRSLLLPSHVCPRATFIFNVSRSCSIFGTRLFIFLRSRKKKKGKKGLRLLPVSMPLC